MIWYTKISGWKTNLNNNLNNQFIKRIFIKKITGGWGNGYVAVPPTHPAYKIDYDTLMYNIDVHGGLTYSEFGDGENAPKDWWVFGFDTSHFQDNLKNWPKEAVEAETKRLYCQLLDIELGEL